MAEASAVPEGVETDRPSVARLYDFFLGGHHNFAADREMGRRLLAAEPNARHIVAENRAFLGRAVRFLLASGIRQFLDLGSGIPTQDNVHEIAQRGDPRARVIYVDNDPVAIAHSKQILSANPLAAAIREDLRQPEAIANHPDVRRLIDFSQPVGLLMVTVLHFVPDADDPADMVGRYVGALAPGSCVAISHATYEAAPKAAAQVEQIYTKTSAAAQTRSHAQILRFFDGLDMVEPGLVYLPLWRPDGPVPDHPERAWFYAGVGRKPEPGASPAPSGAEPA
ncbi:MAG TPA: SAM-dependent methyltransferase [Streptosporangiaceae bacterium]|nr:SAM-dependent methyltransferase [Streptosporangiaceae bacterium]